MKIRFKIKARGFILFVLFAMISSCDEKMTSDKKNKITIFYLIRHAEKDRSNPDQQNPNLTSKGLDRAKHWAKYFDSIPLNSIYTTSYKRTMQTIAPVSKEKKIKPEIYSPNKINIQKFIKTNYGKNVLISGHSNTTPDMVNRLINEKRYTDMLDSDNRSLYVVKFIDSNINVEVRSVYLKKIN
ncbi:MAG: phosphoglycerate mutase family protein [Bacteroidota bacterium]|nr:phosphoglycerate mutase family protein [Bacteroidota bacterium]